MNHHRWVKWGFAGISGKTKEILEIGVFSDLLDGLLVAQGESLLDE
jgi:hypothetical protein